MRTRDDTAPRHRRPARPDPRRRPARVTGSLGLAVACLAAGVVAVHSLSSQQATGDPREPVTAEQRSLPSRVAEPVAGAPAPPARGPVVRAAAVLRAWDERRARAWTAGDVPGLWELYVDGAGAADVRLLRRYLDRHLRVEELTTQLLAVEVLGRGPDLWLLRVTDRVAAGVVADGQERTRLPHDGAETRLIRLVRDGDGAWRVAEVRPVPR